MSVLNGGSDSRASPLKFYRPQWTQHYIITRLDSDPTQVSHVHIHALSPDLCSGGVFISAVPTTHIHRPRQRPTLPFLALRYRLSSLHIVILSLNDRSGKETGLSYSIARLPRYPFRTHSFIHNSYYSPSLSRQTFAGKINTAASFASELPLG